MSDNTPGTVGSLANYFEKISSKNTVTSSARDQPRTSSPRKNHPSSNASIGQLPSGDSFSATNPFLDDIVNEPTSVRLSNPFLDPITTSTIEPMLATEADDHWDAVPGIRISRTPVAGYQGTLPYHSTERTNSAKPTNVHGKTPPPPPKKPDFLLSKSNPDDSFLRPSSRERNSTVLSSNNVVSSFGGVSAIRKSLFEGGGDIAPRYPSKPLANSTVRSVSESQSSDIGQANFRAFSNPNIFSDPFVSGPTSTSPTLANATNSSGVFHTSGAPDSFTGAQKYAVRPTVDHRLSVNSANNFAEDRAGISSQRSDSVSNHSDSLSPARKTTSSLNYNNTPKKEYQVPTDIDDVEKFDAYMKKRANIINEILETEESFANDMTVLKNVFAIPAYTSGLFSEQDLKLLFPNVDEVINFSVNFVNLLSAANTPDPKNSTIGGVFIDALQDMEVVYVEYCKNNETALARVSELYQNDAPDSIKEFLAECKLQMQGRTGAWDLASLVIKPLQRILKYPLLLGQLMKVTPTTFLDQHDLHLATERIEQLADRINELKKRKDIVERYVDRKGPSNIMHGVKKRMLRGAQQVRRGIAGSEIPEDETYLLLRKELQECLMSVEQIKEDSHAWQARMRSYIGCIDSLGMYYRDLAGVHSAEYYQTTTRISTSLRNNIDTRIKQDVFPKVEKLLQMFNDPKLVVEKCEQKRLDYERVMHMIAKGEEIKKHHTEAVDEYQSIRAQLIEELPIFLRLAGKFLDIIVGQLIDVQVMAHYQITNDLSALAALPPCASMSTAVAAADEVVDSIIGRIASPTAQSPPPLLSS